MSREALEDVVQATAARFGMPGAAIGVWADGQEAYACHGVTSLANPLPIDPQTLCVLGSVSKSYTATALMCLVADGRVSLEAPVRRYLPDLRLADEAAAAQVTVLNLLNHTAGLDWDLLIDTGAGDDALARYVGRLIELTPLAQPGARASYSQAGYSLAGRVIEKVVDLPYEQAIASLLFEPLGLTSSFFAPDDVMVRRFAMGHNPSEDGALSAAQLWRGPRCRNPGAGVAASVTDLLRWTRFHLGDGRSADGTQLLPAKLLRQMQAPTVALRASVLGDAIGVGWFLRTIDGVRMVGHGGSANGQFADVLMAPEHDFAVVALSNAGPNGIPFNQSILRWALETYLDVVDRDPDPLPYDDSRAREVAGRYGIAAMTLTIHADGTALTMDVRIRPEIRAAAKTEMPPDHEPADVGLLPNDQYIVTTGALKGQTGAFARDERGEIVGLDLAGRLFRRHPSES